MFNKQNSIKLFITFLFLLLTAVSYAQEEEQFYLNKLDTVVEVLNPVYKPVISFGAGVLNFMGDIKNPGSNPMAGKFGYKINVSTLFGAKNYYKMNIFFILGNLNGQNFDISRKMQAGTPIYDPISGDQIFPNSSFNTDFVQAGLNAEYGFGHMLGNEKKFKPFISIGASYLRFNPKGNLLIGPNNYYHFWADGTIRTLPETDPNAFNARIIPLDNSYETDLPNKNLFGIGTYSQTTLAVPIEIGFDFYLSYRVNLRVAYALNYTFSDQLDNYNNAVAKLYTAPKNGFNDMFSFTYFTLNFDLFSDPKMMKIERVFANADFDYDVMMADQDNDMVFDRWDKCPDTPLGVQVDTSSTSPTYGCPLDSDNDGVYDYADEEPDTPAGTTVDDKGVQIGPEKLAEMFNQNNAVQRKMIRVIPVAPIWTRNISFTPGVIPDKFKKVDFDGDGYISFTELLSTINDYFDEKTNFKPDDIYELNDFFFSQ